MLEALVPDAVKALGDATTSRKNKDRIAAACALLDRCYGRPGQSLLVTHNQPIDAGAVMQALADQVPKPYSTSMQRQSKPLM